MSKKKRQWLTIGSLILVLALACVAYVIVDNKDKEKQKEEKEASSTETISLYTAKKEDIVKLSYQVDKKTETLVLKDGKWYKEEDKELPLEQSLATAMASAMTSVTANKLVSEDVEDMSQFGFDTPSMEIEVTLQDGSVNKLVMGLQTTVDDTNGYYAYIDDSSKVYFIGDTLYSYFNYTGNKLVEKESAPTFDSSNVIMLHVDAKKGEDFKVVYDVEKAENADIYGWDIEKPFADVVAGDVYTLTELFANYSSISYYECVDYKGKSDKKYGLDKPAYTISLEYYESTDDTEETKEEKEKRKKDFTLYIGNLAEDGAYYYARPEGSKRVYTVYKATVEAMTKIDAMSYIYQYCYLGSVNTLDTITMEYDGKVYDMELTRTEKKDKDSEEDTEVTYSATINGKTVEEEDFRMAYAKTGTIQYTGLIDKEKVPADDTPYAKIRMIEGERDTTISFLPYGDGVNFYRANVNGTELFLVDKKAVEELVQGYLDVLNGTYETETKE